MLGAIRAAVRFFKRKIGWHRVGIAISVAIIAIAGIVLYRILRDIAFDEVLDALRDTPAPQVVLASLFVAGGYATLTFYDFFALRTIGKKHVPYCIAALSSLTS